MVKAKVAKKTSASKRWTASSPAAMKLKDLLVKGEIDANARPKEVYDNDTIFHEYSLPQFRANFNKIKAELGVHMRGGKYSCLKLSYDLLFISHGALFYICRCRWCSWFCE